MRKDRDSRKPQRGGVDDENYSPRANFGYAARESSPRFEAVPSGPPVLVTVKWYNPEKGFGFVQLPTGGDAFLHASVLERSGNSSAPPGARSAWMFAIAWRWRDPSIMFCILLRRLARLII